ncbi:HNH endonuclease signature motif containing protein [Rhodovulum marinum]|uniref:HNH endonuclease n=1 Tax=Rhodovulum marinum TaxID=320662 RepID=A0A4R2Q7F3_9RHOB|nr:HNH endonuclease signature motif containing protein [Rhodovulum marinum]TCP43944.1 HNH endonuclease [Rhodovulum marinum]
MASDPRPWRRLYKTAAWRRLSTAQKEREPLCRLCLKRGFANDGSLTSAGAPQSNPRRRHVVADHIVPHKGDEALFYDPDNLQTLCPDDHDRNKQREEVKGFSEERGADGWPLDPRHPANR